MEAAVPQAAGSAGPAIDAAPRQPLLDARHLCGWYGAAQILYDVDLRVGRGEVVALMGRNGAGKSTTLKALIGLLGKRSGATAFMGRDISNAEPYAVARLGLGYVPEDRRIFTDLTVLENLEVGRQPARSWSDGSAAPLWTPERLFKLFPNLGEMPDRPGGRMSGGEQQDADCCPHADGQLLPRAARRAVRRRRSADRRADGGDDRRDSSRPVSASCCRSRTCTSPNWCPTALTCSRRGRYGMKDRWKTLPPTAKCGGRI